MTCSFCATILRERAPIIAMRQAEIKAETRHQQQTKQQTGHQHADTPQRSAAGLTPVVERPAPPGFIPFESRNDSQRRAVLLPHAPHGAVCYSADVARKKMGLLDFKNKRLSADAVRTLESIYERTPFPSKEVIRCPCYRLSWSTSSTLGPW